LNERVRVLHAGGKPEAARALLERVGRLVREMHDRGVWHRDLHSGNILAARDGDGLYLIDLHTCVFQRRLARWQRRGGAAKLIQSLRSTLPLEELRILIQAYGPEALAARGTIESAERMLLEKAERLERKRVKSRSKRCFLPSTQFAVTRSARVRLYHLRKHAASELEPLWREDPPGKLLKASRRGWVAAAKIGPIGVCVKRRRYSVLEGLQALFESHRLRRAYAGGHALAVRGISTPRVIALRERRRFGLVREAHLVTELIEDVAPLDELLFTTWWGHRIDREAARQKHALARSVGELVRAVHDANLYPHDFSPQNVLVRRSALASPQGDSTPVALLTDLDHLYLWQRLTKRGRMRNLAEVANLPEGHVTTADRLRGLKAYARGDAEYLGSVWIRALRTRILDEHFQVLENLGRRELVRAQACEA
jgi:tRNA A-37 threonylcarbamoyl transferase component Bud32